MDARPLGRGSQGDPIDLEILKTGSQNQPIDIDESSDSELSIEQTDIFSEGEDAISPNTSFTSPSTCASSLASPTEKRWHCSRFLFGLALGKSPSRSPRPRKVVGQRSIKEKRSAFLRDQYHILVPLISDRKVLRELISSETAMEIEPKTPVQPPLGVCAILRAHQLESLSLFLYWKSNGVNGILGDEMGLGKTLQILMLFQYVKEQKMRSEKDGPFLVICPLSVLKNWCNEAAKFTPSLNVAEYYGSPDIRSGVRKSVKRGSEIDIVITTYETLSSDRGLLGSLCVWTYIVLDEGHKIKNVSSQCSGAVHKLRAAHKILLTGTPLQNDLKELWSIFHWLYPEMFTPKTSEAFQESFCLAEGKIDVAFLEKVKKFLDVIMLRRTKESPIIGEPLPAKRETRLLIPLSPIQKELYRNILNGIDDSLLEEIQHKLPQPAICGESENDCRADFLSDDRQLVNIQETLPNKRTSSTARNSNKAGNLLMELRKCCIHPYLLDDVAPQPYELGHHIIEASSKFVVLQKLVEQLVLKEKRKMLIFSGFDHALNCCEDLLMTSSDMQEHFRFLRIDGSASRARRNLNIYLFDKYAEYKVFLLSIRAGGEGINLTRATEVVFLDLDWNPQVMLQAEARAHRIGQIQPVTVYKIITHGTIEEQMLSRISKKLYLALKMTERTGSEEVDEEGLSEGLLSPVAVLASSMRCHLSSGPSTEDLAKWTLEEIFRNCQIQESQGPCSSHPVLTANSTRQWLNRHEKIDVTIFEGSKVPKSPKKEGFMDEAEVPDRAQRRIGKNRVVMIDGYPIDKQSLLCKDGEAVPTLSTGTSDRKRVQKREVPHLKSCFACGQGSPTKECCYCPRSFHERCVLGKFNGQSGLMGQFRCSQHRCAPCSKTTSQTGLLFCCRTCHRAYCEECLAWDKTTFVGDSIPEYEALDFSSSEYSFFVECEHCSAEQVLREKRSGIFGDRLGSKRSRIGE